MADTLELQVATPQRQLVRESVTDVQIPGKDGFLGILPGHAALLGLLGTGALAYSSGGSKHYIAIQGGFVEIQGDHVRVLADVAEKGEEIDSNRAKSDLADAESKLTTEPDTAIPAVALAQAKIEAAKNA